MKQFKYTIVALFCFGMLSIQAQQKLEKISKSINVNNDATIDLNTSHTNIEIETWNKDVLEIEAYIESDKLTKEELKEALESWDLEIEGSGSEVSISTSGGSYGLWDMPEMVIVDDVLHNLKIDLADMPEIPVLPEMPVMPEMNIEIPEMPELPELPELPKGIHHINFDTDAYKKDGEKYLEKWSKEYEEKYGKEYKEKMKDWAREFSKTDFDKYSEEMEKWGEEFGEKFGEKFGEDMEKWGEEYAKRFEGEWAEKMEKWGEEFGERFGKQMEERAKAIEERAKAMEERIQEREARKVERLEKRARERERRQDIIVKRLDNRKNHKVKKTLKIKMPKDAKLKLNVRHGELKFASVIHNIRADVSHSSLVANRIGGSATSINASYSPIVVQHWDAGELKLNFVEDANLQHVKTLVLGSNSSNVTIDDLAGNAIIDGSFGDLTIAKILPTFNNINIILENSDALIKLPNTKYNLQFKGNRSELRHPNKSTEDSSSSFSTGDLASGKTIVVNAKYSDVIMQ